MNKFLEDILFIENKIHFLKTSLVWRWNEEKDDNYLLEYVKTLI